ncbi:Protein of unknown function [Ulvibacter litoralis]|uniref:DUF2752 domain-containing protein n=1 Tax=Ulvibacter litoralis TaxID=227084 RepID=A0A1G7CZN1_9FLAO|nr:Protein of unknown function [Ulvibacter litoralis]
MLEVTSKKIITLTLIAAVLGGIFFVFHSYNPSHHSFFLPCPFKYTTGYHCPGCGSQRAIHQLAQGDVTTAFGLNPLMVLSLPLIIYAFGLKLYNYLFSTQLRVHLFYNPFFIYGYFGIVAIYWIARNIPMYPFTVLAPTG